MDRGEELIEEARGCEDCVPWLRHCEAECCNRFTFRLTSTSDVARSGATVRLRISGVSLGLRYYYELHGATFEGDALVVPAAACTFEPELLTVRMRCAALTSDRLCELHPDRKPQVCRALTQETAASGEYRLTERCLFAYRMRAAKAEESPGPSEPATDR